MKVTNQFIHHDYRSEPSAEFYELLKPNPSVITEAVDLGDNLTEAGRVFSNSGIERIVLVHGTMVGTDSLGWYGHWERSVPWLSRRIEADLQTISGHIIGGSR